MLDFSLMCSLVIHMSKKKNVLWLLLAASHLCFSLSGLYLLQQHPKTTKRLNSSVFFSDGNKQFSPGLWAKPKGHKATTTTLAFYIQMPQSQMMLWMMEVRILKSTMTKMSPDAAHTETSLMGKGRIFFFYLFFCSSLISKPITELFLKAIICIVMCRIPTHHLVSHLTVGRRHLWLVCPSSSWTFDYQSPTFLLRTALTHLLPRSAPMPIIIEDDTVPSWLSSYNSPTFLRPLFSPSHFSCVSKNHLPELGWGKRLESRGFNKQYSQFLFSQTSISLTL